MIVLETHLPGKRGFFSKIEASPRRTWISYSRKKIIRGKAVLMGFLPVRVGKDSIYLFLTK